jgi:hypothetical protein
MTNNNKKFIKNIGKKTALAISTAAALTVFSPSYTLAGGGSTFNRVEDMSTTLYGQYITDQIMVLLEKNLAGSAFVSAGAQFGPDSVATAHFLNNVIVGDAIDNMVNDRAVIVVNHGNSHWASLVIQQGVDAHGDPIRIAVYNDPSGASLRDGTDERTMLLNALLHNGIHQANIIDGGVQQQHDGDSCGAFAAETLIQLAQQNLFVLDPDGIRNLLATINDAQAIRRAHNIILYGKENTKAAETIVQDVENRTSQIANTISQITSLTQDRLNNLNFQALGVASGDEGLTHGAWVKGFYGTEKDSTHSKKAGNSSVTNSKLYGFIAGVDTKINEDITIGLAYSKGDSNSKGKDTGKQTSSNNISSNAGSVYGSAIISDNAWVNGNVTYGKATAKMENKIRTTDKKSKQNISFFGGAVAANYNIPLIKDISLTPRVGLSYLQIDAASYKDNIFKIAKSTLKEARLNAGMAVNFLQEMQNFTLGEQLTIDYSHGIWSNNSKVNIRENIFNTLIKSQKIADRKGILKLGAGINAKMMDERLELGANYETSWQKKIRGHVGYLKLRVNF